MRILVLGILLMTLSPPSRADDAPEALYGHLPYSEAPQEALVQYCEGSSNLLRQEVAEVVKAMAAAAKAKGVTLRAMSCFRSLKSQDYLFYGIAKKRGQTPEERARVSAPPGHSEHHSGYAIDFGDEDRGTDLEQSFATSPAGQWLLAYGTEYGFELSFPDGNTQGVAFEPWHWRYVGTPEAMEVFHWARQLFPASPAVATP
mgnify:CR=1 FL=1